MQINSQYKYGYGKKIYIIKQHEKIYIGFQAPGTSKRLAI